MIQHQQQPTHVGHIQARQKWVAFLRTRRKVSALIRGHSERPPQEHETPATNPRNPGEGTGQCETRREYQRTSQHDTRRENQRTSQDESR
ncbi:unnamed protein product [Arctogadus glacialis]